MVLLLEVAPEILYLILGQDGQGILHLSDYGRLCLVNHALRAAVLPILWKSLNPVRTSQVISIYKVIIANPELAKLVQTFRFFPRNTKPKVWRQPILIDGVHVDLSHIFKSLVPMLENLQHLRLDRSYRRNEQKSEVSSRPFISLEGNTKIETIAIHNFQYSPASVDNIIALPHLKHVELGPGFDRLACINEIPKATSKATSLTLCQLSSLSEYSFWYPRVRGSETSESEKEYEDLVFKLISSTISCFANLQRLDVVVLAAAFNDGRLHDLLSAVEERSGLTYLKLGLCGWPARNAQPIDFHAWRNLQELDVDANIFWPPSSSWSLRNELYRKLPQALEILKIHTQFTEDGLFHIYTGREDWSWDPQTEAPAERYVWLLNLLATSVEDVRVLPHLRYMDLREDVHHTIHSGIASEIVEGHLPQNLASRFDGAGVDVSIKVRYFHVLEFEESEYSDD